MSMSNDSQSPRRGAYRIAESARDRELLRDPDVAAFAKALEQIQDLKKIACLRWLVLELSRVEEQKKR